MSGAPGKPHLLISGILLCLNGVVGFAIILLPLVTSGRYMFSSSPMVSVAGSIGLLVSLFAIAIAAIPFAIGIIGIVNRDRPENAMLCLRLGIILCILFVLNFVLGCVDGLTFGKLLSNLFALLIVFCYAYGAHLNSQYF